MVCIISELLMGLRDCFRNKNMRMEQTFPCLPAMLHHDLTCDESTQSLLMASRGRNFVYIYIFIIIEKGSGRFSLIFSAKNKTENVSLNSTMLGISKLREKFLEAATHGGVFIKPHCR